MPPVLGDFSLGRYEDALLNFSLNPPVAVGGWGVQFLLEHRFGGLSGIIIGTVASGYSSLSGIAVTNSGQGVFQVTVPGMLTSGLDYGNYAYTLARVDSGSYTNLAEGYLSLMPGR